METFKNRYIYMQQPKGFEEEGRGKLVCKLKKSMYGLKQAPREWYHKFHSNMLSQGYHRSDTDHEGIVKKQALRVSLLQLKASYNAKKLTPTLHPPLSNSISMF